PPLRVSWRWVIQALWKAWKMPASTSVQSCTGMVDSPGIARAKSPALSPLYRKEDRDILSSVRIQDVLVLLFKKPSKRKKINQHGVFPRDTDIPCSGRQGRWARSFPLVPPPQGLLTGAAGRPQAAQNVGKEPFGHR